ncbi:MAG: MerR family transcriptional regulator [Methylotenera sp.]|uniref:MerR family transcriptional regulator n=1 Tax=Methylotenera sp. TaxID=2051956 RepID=UPI000D417344|nr:MerR family transcriptional regulator [Methylotenera sp.]PPC81710.1 MAG: MerR family transcriptional regulator [Methylotenera sp.]
MTEQVAKVQLPPIPAKRYFTIGEVSELCGVKPHVLRYWEQEFTQLKPVKRRGNRRYYQHHEVLLIRRIRELLYEQGFTISGARNRLDDLEFNAKTGQVEKATNVKATITASIEPESVTLATSESVLSGFDYKAVKAELREILNLLRADLSSAKVAL